MKNYIRSVLEKTVEEELGTLEFEKCIRPESLDRLAFTLSEIQSEKKRKEKLDQVIKMIKEICKRYKIRHNV